MKMNKEEYEKLMKRFSLEISEVGVTDSMIEIVRSQTERAPNIVSVSADEVTDRFVYRHNGYVIEATREVKISIKKCK